MQLKNTQNNPLMRRSLVTFSKNKQTTFTKERGPRIPHILVPPHLTSPKPPVPHVITNCFGRWHGTGKFACSNNCSAAFLDSLQWMRSHQWEHSLPRVEGVGKGEGEGCVISQSYTLTPSTLLQTKIPNFAIPHVGPDLCYFICHLWHISSESKHRDKIICILLRLKRQNLILD